jgi:hypothetical protein
MRGEGKATALAVLLAGMLLAAAPAGATIAPVPNTPADATNAVNNAAAGPGFAAATGTMFSQFPTAGTPVGIETATIAPFPRPGSSFLVLSTGDVTQADLPDVEGEDFPSSQLDGALVAGRGDTARDVTTLHIVFVTAGDSCLSFDYRFLSEEYPEFIDSEFNDAFIAEIGPTTWSTSGSVVTGKENDFALDPNGNAVTIKSTGPTSMSPAEAVGTPFGGATAPLHAQTPVLGEGAHDLWLSIFDQQDSVWDTAVFVDNISLTALTPGCTSGSTGLGPALSITGPAVDARVETQTPTLTGTAGNAAGDASTVTVRIYSGEVATGAPIQTLTAPRSGASWSVVTGALPLGDYTAQATQTNAQGINGISGPVKFHVVAPAAQLQSAPSLPIQQVGDRDGDGIPDNVDTNDGSRPPVPGKSVQVRVVSGQVFIKLPGGGRSARATGPPKGFVPLQGAANVPVGSQLDTEQGRVALTSAADTGATKTQTADFYDGIFQVKQAVPKKKPKKPAPLITDLVLKGASASQCAPLKGARSAAANKKKGPKSVLGKLWGNGKGKFRTAGKYSSATVRGTIWLTQDECDGTLTKVTRGTVIVRDFKRKKTVTVKAGHSYLARAQRAASKAKRRVR